MKTNSHKTNRKFWLSAAIGCAVTLMGVDSRSADAQTNTYPFPSTGNVGIGTTSPSTKLEVVAASIADGVRITGNSTGNLSPAFALYDSSTPRGFFGLAEGSLHFSASAVAGDIVLRANTGKLLLQTGTGAAALTINAGQIGIGTTTPGRQLEIADGNSGLGTQLRLYHTEGDEGVNPGSTEIEFLHAGNQLATSKMRVVRTFNQIGSSNTDFYLDLVKGNAGDNGNTTNTVLFAQGLTGNLGIGKTNPNYKLDVNGTFNATAVNVNGSPVVSSQWAPNGTKINYGAGNVGIGTGMTAPLYPLDVVGDIHSSTGFRFPDGNLQSTAAQGIFKNISDSGGITRIIAGSNNDTLQVVGSGGTTVTLDGATKKIIIDGSTSTPSAANISSGQFGQNTGGGNYTFPGNLTVNGNIAAKYQDMAEWVPSSEQLPTGTVVVLDSTKSNQVITRALALTIPPQVCLARLSICRWTLMSMRPMRLRSCVVPILSTTWIRLTPTFAS